MRYTIDNAPGHIDAPFWDLLMKWFNEQGWVVRRQPPNSPMINVHDAALFPSLSKTVSKNQAFKYQSRHMRGNELWETCLESWKKMKLEKIARAFALHHQIINAIYYYEGSNNYLYEKKDFISIQDSIIIEILMCLYNYVPEI